MDEELRRAIRTIQRSGRVEETVLALLEGLGLTKEKLAVNRAIMALAQRGGHHAADLFWGGGLHEALRAAGPILATAAIERLRRDRPPEAALDMARPGRY